MYESMGKRIFQGAFGPIRGVLEVPGDKSISHRAAIIASLANGKSVISNIACGEDMKSTLNCLENLGIRIEYIGENEISIEGYGLFGYKEPHDVLNARNSATTLRLMAGILSGQDMLTVITGDDSLRKRPMRRIVQPLKDMGARIWGRTGGGFAPLVIQGGKLSGINHVLKTPSAQVKSCLLLAGLFADGATSLDVLLQSRDHTERILELAEVDIERREKLLVIGDVHMRRNPMPFEIYVPGDISSAAFFIAAATVLDGSFIEILNVGINPTRTGFLDALIKAGVSVEISSGTNYPEPMGNIKVKSGPFKGFHISPEDASGMIDELPILMVLATKGEEPSIIEGAGELRVKESDRITVLVDGLRKMGANIQVEEDTVVVHPSSLKGEVVDSKGDHRMAMAFAIASLIADGETTIEGFDSVNVSYPNFEKDLRMLLT